MDKKIYLTKEGLEELKAEYEEIIKKKRPEVVLRLAAARDQGDLSENAEYSAARDELSFIDGRIDELEELLRQVELIEEPKKGSKTVVSLGSTVTLHLGKKQDDFTVVGEWEADPAAKKISDQSPLGKALIGKTVGEKVEVEAPAGKILYTILSVK